MTNILITGGAGFIGSSLATRLATDGHVVSLLDSLSAQIHGANPERSPLVAAARQAGRLIVADVRNREAMAAALEGQDMVVHFAAETGTGQSMYQIAQYADVNVGGTALLLDLIASDRARYPVKRLVVASSRAVYGEGRYRDSAGNAVWPSKRQDADMLAGQFDPVGPDGAPLSAVATTEDSPFQPTSVYGITKQAQEQLVLMGGGALGLETVALRYQNVYGPGQSLSNPYTGILSIFSNRIRSGQGINIFEDGRESRDFIFIDDVVEATVRSLFARGAAGRAINVGTGTATSVLAVAQTLSRLYGRDVPLAVSGQFRSGDIRHNFADTTLAEALLEFRAAISFEDGVRRFAQWVEASAAHDDSGYERSLAELDRLGLMKGRPLAAGPATKEEHA